MRPEIYWSVYLRNTVLRRSCSRRHTLAASQVAAGLSVGRRRHKQRQRFHHKLHNSFVYRFSSHVIDQQPLAVVSITAVHAAASTAFHAITDMNDPQIHVIQLRINKNKHYDFPASQSSIPQPDVLWAVYYSYYSVLILALIPGAMITLQFISYCVHGQKIWKLLYKVIAKKNGAVFSTFLVQSVLTTVLNQKVFVDCGLITGRRRPHV